MSAAKPDESSLTKIHPEVAPNIYDFSNKRPQGKTKPAVGARPDMSNDVAADGRKQNNDAVAAGKYDKSRENYSDDSDAAAPINEPDEKTQPAEKTASADKPESADKPASSSSVLDYWHNLQKLWSSEVANSIGYSG